MTPTVLCVDDDPSITQMLKLGLSSKGFAVFTAGTVLEALGIIRRIELDLVILDLMLPDIDGYGFFELLAEEPTNRHVPVVVVTGCTSPEARRIAIEHGAIAYVAKPFELRELVAEVGKALANPQFQSPAARVLLEAD